MYDACAAKGLRVASAVLADVQGVNGPQQFAIWHLAWDVSRNRWNVFLRVGNEDGANGYDCGGFDRPQNMGGVLCSRGSRGINTPPHPNHWDFAEWEPRRDPTFKALDDAGAGILELRHGYAQYPGGVPVPLVVIEPPFFHDSPHDQWGDTRWTDPRLALQLGLNIGANCPGGAFGASDGLICQPLQPRAAECARQFFRGLRGAFLR